MSRFFALMPDGKTHIPEAIRFAHYVNNVRFWFAAHPTPGYIGSYTVSHWSLGMKVCTFGTFSISAFRGDVKSAAKHALDKFCEEKTHARVYDVMTRAEKQAVEVKQ